MAAVPDAQWTLDPRDGSHLPKDSGHGSVEAVRCLDASAQLGHASSAITEKYYIQRADLGPDARETLASFAADPEG